MFKILSELSRKQNLSSSVRLEVMFEISISCRLAGVRKSHEAVFSQQTRLGLILVTLLRELAIIDRRSLFRVIFNERGNLFRKILIKQSSSSHVPID